MRSDVSPGFRLFQALCAVVGAQDPHAGTAEILSRDLPGLVDTARRLELLPALAVRCRQVAADTAALDGAREDLLAQALMDNTRRNMQIVAQSVKLTRSLNRAGVAPLLLKGTAGLLVGDNDDIGFRRQADIDLLVAPEDIATAGDALLADGYRFCRFPDNATAVPLEPGDTASARRTSAAHHHLPPLVREGYAVTVELHTHFLPRRFQRKNPLESLLAQARTVERHGVRFRVPSTEHRLIHLVLGKFVHDGCRSRHTFPIREGCDLIGLLEQGGATINHELVQAHCGTSYPLFLGLACELMGCARHPSAAAPDEVEQYLGLLRRRFASPAICRLLDARARVDHLAHQLVYSPLKLPAYLRRRWPMRNDPARSAV